MTVPFAVMTEEFLNTVRALFVRGEPTAKRLHLAAHGWNGEGAASLEQALALSPNPMRGLLLDMLGCERTRDDIGPGYSLPAASLFLYGVKAGHWTATPQEIEQARAPFIALYGKETIDMLAPEKIVAHKVPHNLELVNRQALPISTPLVANQIRRRVKNIVDDYLYVQSLSDEAELIAARKPIDLDALGVAFGDYLAALKRYFPKAYEVQTERLRKQFAPVVAKAIVELVEKAPATALSMLEIIK